MKVKGDIINNFDDTITLAIVMEDNTILAHRTLKVKEIIYTTTYSVSLGTKLVAHFSNIVMDDSYRAEGYITYSGNEDNYINV